MKKVKYRNRIDQALGITMDDLPDYAKRSHTLRQRLRQKARWYAHLARKNAA